jgi:Methylamine utilisation protein MauE
MDDVNDQPSRQQPEEQGAVSTGVAAHPAPPGDGHRAWRLWAATAARLLLAGVWAWAALAKISDPDAAVRAVRAYELLPEALVRPVA